MPPPTTSKLSQVPGDAKPHRKAAVKTHRSRSRSNAQGQWLIGGSACIVVIALMLAGSLDVLERLTFDSRAALFDRASPPPFEGIALAAIDDSAIERVGRWPWSRSKLASVVDELRILDAKVIALDLLLDDPQTSAEANPLLVKESSTLSGESPDEQLAAAIARHGKVITGTNFRFSVDETRDGPLIARCQSYLKDNPHLLEPLPDEAALRSMAVTLAEKLATQSSGASEPNAQPSDLGEDDRFKLSVRLMNILGRMVATHKLMPASSFPAGDFDAVRAIDASPPVMPIARAAFMTGNVTFNSFDADGKARRIPIVVRSGDRLWPSLGLAAATAFVGYDCSQLSADGQTLVVPMADGSSHRVVTDRAMVGDVRRGGVTLVTWPRGTPSDSDRKLVETDWGWQFYDQTRAKQAEISLGSVFRLATLRQIIALNTEQAVATAAAAYGQDDPALLEPAERTALREAITAGEADLALPLMAAAAAKAKEFIEFQTDGVRPEEIPEPLAKTVTLLRLAGPSLPEQMRAIATQRREMSQLTDRLRARVANRIVFIGFTATGTIADFVPTSISPKTPGVHLHMAIANSVLQDFQRIYGPAWADVLMAACLGTLGILAAMRFGVVGAPLATLGVSAAWFSIAGALLWDQQRTIVAVAGPSMAAIAGCGSVILQRLAVEQRARRETEKRFKSYVSPKVVDILMNNPNLDSMLPQRRELSILFTDLAGFTGIAERLGSQRTAEVLRLYLGPMTETLQDFDGTLDKYIGDAIMAFWGAPVENERHAEMCCRAGLAMLTKLDAMNASLTFGESLALSMRVGVATGEVMVGDFGNPPRNSSYTVLGDTANLSSRLEGANRMFGSRLLTTSITRAAVQDGAPADVAAWLWRPIGKVAVKGKQDAVELWELVGTLRPKAEQTETWVTCCTQLVETFARGDLDGAEHAAAELERQFGSDVFSDLYRQAIADVRAGVHEPGKLHLTEK